MPHPSDIPAMEVPVPSVSELTRRIRGWLEPEFSDVWVGGEISNFRSPASGHFYFRMKDEHGQLAAVMFRSAARALPFHPDDGMDVIAHGRVGIYPVRGDLQLYVDALEPRGRGSLHLALEQLKKRLADEGLFAEERKRALPAWPRAVGIATAITGAAIRDMISTLRARLPGVRIIVRPALVQGRDAGTDLVAALADLNLVSDVDVIIVGRGGGSLEDLWAFNEEPVARAIAASRTPVVSAVGHETDVTLSDLVADRRAATPTAAADLVVPDAGELRELLRRQEAVLRNTVAAGLRRRAERVASLQARLRDPRQAIRTWRLRSDELLERARRGVDSVARVARRRVQAGAERLDALSPLAVLGRGYSLVRRVDDQKVVRDAKEINPRDRLEIRFARGRARVRVEDCAE